MNTRLLVALCAALTVTACAPLQTQQNADTATASSAGSSVTETRMRGIEARLDRLERQLAGLGNLDLVEQVQRLQQETRDLRGSLEQNSYRLENFQSAPEPKANLSPTAAQPIDPLNFPELPVTINVPESEVPEPEVPEPEVPEPEVPATPPAPAVSQFEIPAEPVIPAPSKVERIPAATAEVETAVDTAAASLGFGAPAASAPIAAAPAVPQSTAVVVADAKERGRYEQAFDLLKNGRYGDSIAAFEGFLKTFPNGEYAGNAQYWLGEAHYVTRAFDAAVREFTKVIDNYSNSPKYADSLLKLGYVHYELKQWQKARARLTQVIKKTPGTTIAKLAQQRLDRIRREGN